jgi:ankyrin repeat protein
MSVEAEHATQPLLSELASTDDIHQDNLSASKSTLASKSDTERTVFEHVETTALFNVTQDAVQDIDNNNNNNEEEEDGAVPLRILSPDQDTAFVSDEEKEPRFSETRTIRAPPIEADPRAQRIAAQKHVPIAIPIKASASLALPGGVHEEPELTLHHAAQQGDISIIRRLLDSGQAGVNDRDFQNVTALHWGAINNRLEVVRLLLDRGAEVDAVGGDLLATPLHWACRRGHLQVCALLLERGADPTKCDAQGFNALHLAVHSSNALLVLYMLYAPIDVAIDSPDAMDHTALMWAAYQGDVISMDILIRHGASLRAVDKAGFTALHWAISKGHIDATTKLLRAGADVNAREEKGRTPADMARELRFEATWLRALKLSGVSKTGQEPVISEVSHLRHTFTHALTRHSHWH